MKSKPKHANPKERRSYYFDRKGAPKLRHSFCVFMDVLGFGSLINPSAKRKEAQQQFDWYYGVLLPRLKTLETDGIPAGDRSGWQIKIFTDNIVLGCRCDGRSEREFGDLFYAVADHQLTMALEGLFVRGAMTVGPLFMDERIVYGPALLDAHRIESEVACYPRIVLSKTATGFVEFQCYYYENPNDAPHTRSVLVDADGESFLNYLLAVYDRNARKFKSDLLLRHKEVVAKNLEAHRHNARVMAKYLWVATYHNWFCNWLKNGGIALDPKFFVPDAALDRSPRRLRVKK